MINLLSNAIKFTDKGSVTYGVSVADDGKQVEIYVRDTGIGISKEKQKIIFEPFRQAEMKTTRKFGGTGLGFLHYPAHRFRSGRRKTGERRKKGRDSIAELGSERTKENSRRRGQQN